ncbi:SdrD B-like domain-containing protein [Telluribacter sp. SYSU D00476]|uniref:Ig-like domain-containing protein n=1 Tax=Telluribacter sp. SYSU D00476 TaxID=2811430 RepID=UPI001FF0EBF4|nr:SdrD B-like domain-containing protein [Telluribacter sp. SYSU D00476]
MSSPLLLRKFTNTLFFPNKPATDGTPSVVESLWYWILALRLQATRAFLFRSEGYFARAIFSLAFILLAFTTASAQIDLSLGKSIDISRPAIGQTITYTITVKNSGFRPATNVTVRDSLPIGGVEYISNSLVRGGVSYTAGTGIWNVGTVAANDSAILQIKARVLAQGVFFNVAEVQTATEDDQDSWPGDRALDQDDIAVSCFSVPIDWYPGDEFLVEVPTGYKGIKWYYNGTEIKGSAVANNQTVAEVNSDQSLTIKGPGSFTFTSIVGISCPATGCCAIEIVHGAYGSIGDFVWIDTNQDGIQNAGEPGVPNAMVVLQNENKDSIRITYTNSEGKYLFDSLISGTYYVQFYHVLKEIHPSRGFTVPNQGGDDSRDSNVGTGLIGDLGRTTAITIDTSKPQGDILRNNHTIDAGIVVECRVDLTIEGYRTICEGESITLTHTNNLYPGKSIKWYTSKEGGTPFATIISGQPITLKPITTTDYYIEVELGDYCKPDTNRRKITINVNPKPTTPTIPSTVQNTCPDTLVNLTSINPAPSVAGGVFEWRTGSSPVSARVADPTKVANGTYYLFEKSPAGCYSSPAVVTVNIASCDCQLAFTVDAGSDQEICTGESINLTATISGVATGVTWTSAGTGTFTSSTSLLTKYTPSAADIAAGVVVLTATTNDPDGTGLCKPKTDAVKIVINARPAPVFGVACDDTLICQGKSTKLIGFAPDMTIKWYTQATGGNSIGTTVSGGKLTVSPTATTTYYAEAISDKGCVSERTPITVAVQACYADLAVTKTVITPAPYVPGQTVTYAITVKNNGVGNARNVTVNDVLPATLTFASAVPAGEYSNTTGVWAIGDMTATASRTLIINATIKGTATGNITNVAYVRSPDNDPTKPSNDTSKVTIPVTAVADLMLAKKVSKTNPALNEVITYTLEVINKGPAVATNVEVTDPLPAGLEFVSSSTMTKIGTTLKGTFASIGVNETKTLTFTAKVTGSGSVVNTAQITKSDQPDPNSTPGNGYDKGEDDDSKAEITIGCPALEPPVIACATTNICVGESVTLTAVGCRDGSVQWSNGMTGASITVGLNATTTFTAICKKDACVSGASNAITIKVNNPTKPVLASNVTSVCVGGSATLTAANCVGSIIWSNGATGSPLVVTPTETTTYTAYCKQDNCISETASLVINVTTPGPAPIVTCAKEEICPGESVTLTAHECAGQVQWSNGAMGTSITVNPTVNTVYSAKCVVNGCVSQESVKHEIKVITPKAPLIAANKTTVCPATPVTLTATGCDGTVRWSNGATGSSVVVTLNATQSFTATCKTSTCLSNESNVVTITVTTPAAPIISANKTVICSGDSVRLSAIGCNGTVQWSNGMTGSSITVKPTSTTDYTATCKVDACASGVSNTVRVNVNTSGPAPVIAANKTNICVGDSVTLTATGCTGTVNWSNGMTGASIKVKPTATTEYTAVCKGSASCASAPSNKLTINVGQMAAPVIAATKTNICVGDSVTLTATGCTGTITWSNGMTGASIKVKPATTTIFKATCASSTCTSEAGVVTINVTSPPAPTVVCSKEVVCKGESVTMQIVGCAGTPEWSTGQTAGAIVVTPLVTTTYTARCVVNGCKSPVSGSYTITVVDPAKPTLTASATQVQKGVPVTITAAGCTGGTIKWTNGAVGSSITVSPAATTTYGAVCATTAGCTSDTAKIAINVYDCTTSAPVISASTATVCKGGNVTLTAANCTGQVTWSGGKTGSSITVPVNATTTFTAVCKVDACISPVSNSVTVSVVELNAPTLAASSMNICAGDEVTLTAMSCSGNVVWSNGMTGASISVKPTATTSYTAICKLGACESVASAPATITVGSTPAPVIQASATSICFGDNVTLTANGCSNGAVIWSNGLTGSSITISPAVTTTFTAKCFASGSCKSGDSNAITVTVGSKVVKPVTTTLTNACPVATVNLATAVTSTPTTTGGVFVYRTGNTPNSPAVSNPAAVSTSGTYYVFEKTTTGCYSEPSAIVVTIINCNDQIVACQTNPATANAGNDATICAALSYKLSGSIGGAATSAVWTTTGKGTFDNANSLTATYYPTLEDLMSGSVTLTLTTNDPDGAGICQPGKASMKLTIQGIAFRPNILINGVAKTDTIPTHLNICAGDSVVLTATDIKDANNNAYKYKWNGGTATTGNRFVIKQSGTYYVTLVNSTSCVSVPSAKVVVTVGDAVPTPVVVNKRNICPSTTVDLRSAIMSTALVGGTFEYRVGSSPTSALVAAPHAVGEGTYYVFQKSATGCYSAPAKVDVKVYSCGTETPRADLEIIKLVDKANVQVGDSVVYTLKLRNYGPDTATNIAVIDILPAGLEFVLGTGFEVNGNIIKAVIPKLAPNDSIVNSCGVLVTDTGRITNTVRILSLDQVDPVLTNNESSVDIHVTNAERDSVGLGVAMGIINIEPSFEDTYIVAYRITLKNFGTKALTNVQLNDSLTKAFPQPVEFHVMGSAEVGAGSTLVVNPAFNGKDQADLLQTSSTLPAGATEVVTLYVRVKPNGSFGPFYNSVVGSGKSGTTLVQDISNNGFIPLPEGSMPTPVRFDMPNILGVAMLAGTPVVVETGIYDIPYTIRLSNLGMNNLDKVQVVTDLATTFGNGAMIVPGSVSLSADAGLTVNPSYTGQGTATQMLVDSMSNLPKAFTREIYMTVRVDVRATNARTFVSTAIGTAMGGGVMVTDSSMLGTDVDPDNDLDPGNNSTPTRVDLDNSGSAYIGVAMAVSDTLRMSDGSYNITYKVVVKNYSTQVMTNVQLVDSLAKVFNSQTGATFRKVGTPTASNQSTLAINPDFDGDKDVELLLAANSTLNAGAADTLTFIINVSTDGRQVPYINQVYASASVGDTEVSDLSTSGLIPDLNGNSDPTEATENEPTPIIIPAGTELFIPEGFSPNGDGINDLFVIRNTGGQTVILEVYNRWMTLVYKNDDYRNDWDGSSNTGIRVGNSAQGLPDGTYFYVVKLSDGRRFVRYLTISR